MGMTTKQIIRQLTNIEKLYQPVTPLVINEAKELAKKYQQLQADYEKLVDENKQLKAYITMMQADYNARLKDNNELINDLEELRTMINKFAESYETRLKADMVAMLTDLSMKIGEIEDGYAEFDEENKRSLTMIPLESVERLIDGEINSLTAEGSADT